MEQMSEEERRRWEKINLRRFLDEKRLREATRTSRDGFEIANGKNSVRPFKGPQ